MNPALAHPVFIALKASLAALLALALVDLLHVPDRLSATFVSVACLTPTVYSGVRRGLEQLGASAVGGGITWALEQFLPPAPAMAAGVFLAIWISFRVGLGRGFLVASFTVLYVTLVPGLTPGVTLVSRLESVALGVVSAVVVNLAVSLVAHRSVFRRRLGIARASLAAEFRRLADALAESRAPQDLFEGTFPLLRTLHEELADAVHESRLRGKAHRKALEAAQGAAHHLLAVAHHGKDLAWHLSQGAPIAPGDPAAARALAAALEQSAPLPALVASDQSPAFEFAAEAWERGRAAEAAFRG